MSLPQPLDLPARKAGGALTKTWTGLSRLASGRASAKPASAGASGVVLSGVITDALTWRWVFFINVPVGITALMLTARVIPSWPAKVRTHLDLRGALLVTGAMLLFVFTVVETSSHSWGSPRTLGGLGLAGALMLAFVLQERGAPAPLVPLVLARRRATQATSAIMVLAAAGLLAMFFFLTLYMQDVLGWSPLRTGLSYLPFSFTIVLSSALTVKAMTRVPSWLPLLIGPAIGGAGLFVLSNVSASGNYAGALLPGLILVAAGLGLAFVPITALATDHIGEEAAGVASGLLTTCQQVGGAVGIAALVTVATNHTDSLLHLGVTSNLALLDGFQLALRIGSGLLLAAAVLVVLTRRLLSTLPAAAAPPAASAASSTSGSRSGAPARA